MTHWRREMRQQAAQVLGSLGDDSQGVARRLRESGVRGVPGDTRECAIAMYLSAVVAADPGVRTLKVRTDRVVISPARGWHRPIVVGLPGPVCTFVAGFDRRAYPELIRTETDRPERATLG